MHGTHTIFMLMRATHLWIYIHLKTSPVVQAARCNWGAVSSSLYHWRRHQCKAANGWMVCVGGVHVSCSTCTVYICTPLPEQPVMQQWRHFLFRQIYLYILRQHIYYRYHSAEVYTNYICTRPEGMICITNTYINVSIMCVHCLIYCKCTIVCKWEFYEIIYM